MTWLQRLVEFALVAAMAFLLGWFAATVYGPGRYAVRIDAPGATVLPQEFKAAGGPVIVYRPPVPPVEKEGRK